MLTALQPMIDGGIINEDTRREITEAWNTQLAEAKEQVRSELREEFARRYEHDKTVMVEALDKMVTDSLRQEIVEFKEEKQALQQDRVDNKKLMRESNQKIKNFIAESLSSEIKELRTERKFNKQQMNEMTSKIQNFIIEALAREMTELRSDRKLFTESVGQLEQFVMTQLAGEIHEFEKDKQDIVETKVKLVAGAKKKLAEMQDMFIQKSAKLVKESVSKSLKSELTQLKEDINIARENMFGRRIFEAFVGEFSVTHLNENKELAKLQSLVKAKNRQLEEAKKIVSKSARLVESKNKEVKVLTESVTRKQTLSELLSPLSREKANVMSDLLEGVQTDKLRSVYDKYLPAVLNSPKPMHIEKRVLKESRSEVTGDKAAKPVMLESDNVIELKRLAGLK